MFVEKEVMDAIVNLEADPDNGSLPVQQLVDKLSMWRAHEDKCRLFPKIYNQKLIPDDSTYFKLMRHQKLAVCKAIGYMRFPQARKWEVSSNPFNEYTEYFKEDKIPGWANDPEADRSIRPINYSPSSQFQVVPPGAGKTAVIIYLAALASRNSLIITNSRENAVQIVNAIYEHTNLPSSFPVKLIRSNEEELKEKDFVIRKPPSADDTHILIDGGVYGISVIDVHTFHSISCATADRHGLRLLIFASVWDLVIIDEADSVVALQMRQAFTHGAVGEVLPADCETSSSTKLRYKLNYSKLIAMSGTWHRSDPAGAQFLASLGLMTYSIKSRELEDLGHLAKMKVVLVRCVDKDPLVKKYATQYNFASLTPEKLRVCERLVRLHVAYGHKIMIFTKNHWHLRHLERLFPFALAPTGETNSEDFAKMLKLFKSEVSVHHPLIWITTTKGEVGTDIPDTSVVINLVNQGDSPRVLKQRMGRASRKMFVFGWFYDLVSDDETPWAHMIAPCLTGEEIFPLNQLLQNATRYKLLSTDGYDDNIERVCSDTLVQLVDEHVTWMNSTQMGEFYSHQTDVMDETDPVTLDFVMNAAATSAKRLNDNLVYSDSNTSLAVADHVISCILGSFYTKEEDKCRETLFDTQSQLKLKKPAVSSKKCTSSAIWNERLLKNSTGDKTGEKRNLLDFKRKATKKVKTETSKDRNVFGTKLLTKTEYDDFKIPEQLKNEACSAAILDALRYFEIVVGSGPSVVSPTDLWKHMMNLRYEVNKLQYETDNQRSNACNDVLTFGDMTQKHCKFLH